jgi:uncharacterized DUF497 family protein
MRITFDPAKNERNVAERGLTFDLVADLDWSTAIAVEDTRKSYGEVRLRVSGLLNGRLHVAVITRRGSAVHVISFRKANDREVKRYAEERRSGLTP